MNESRLRTQASIVSIEDDDSDYLQKLVDIIIQNKDRLSSNLKSRLRDTFGKQLLQRTIPLQNREDALNRVYCVEREDIRLPEHLSGAIARYAQRGDLFWAGESSNNNTTYFTSNVLSDLFHANKRGTIANNVRRAFYCVALYRIMQRIMKLHGNKTLTKNMKSICADLILKGSDTNYPQEKDEIIKELTSDYGVGCAYEPYARKGGNGIIFYLFVVPPNVYEKYLNKSDDVDTVLHHYKSTGFQQESSTISAAANIMDVINDRFESQISLFRNEAIAPHHFIKPTPKRGRYNKSPAKPSSSKRLKTGQPTSLGRPSYERERSSEISWSNHAETSVQLATFHLDGTSSINPERANCALRPSAVSLDQPSSDIGAQSTINDLEENRVPRLLEPTTVIGPSVQQIADINFRQHSSLTFGADTTSNTARLMDRFQPEPMICNTNAAQLMDRFQPESMIYNTNAAELMNRFQPELMNYSTNDAQLMHDFHQETFNPAEQLNAAQLMQQFDWFDGNDDLQQV